ncbi:MAG: guanylate kinase [Opitutaceae bacterium]|nr:guanylate kinase [Opitutaceae bacterium]
MSTRDAAAFGPAGAAPALLVILAGPAGSGKSTLCERIVGELSGFERVVTSTTRAPRPGEVNGRDYHFFSEEEFDRLVGAGAFLEWARVHGHNRRYGTLRRSIDEKLSAHIDLCMNVDVQGVASIRRVADSDAVLARRLVTIFLMPPDLDELRRRLHVRGQDSDAEIERRMETARREMEQWRGYDFCVRSRSREEDFATVRAIITAEKHRVARLG